MMEHSLEDTLPYGRACFALKEKLVIIYIHST